MKILPLALTLLASCSGTDAPAADDAGYHKVSVATCRETQVKDKQFRTADLDKALSAAGFVLDMKHRTQVFLYRASFKAASACGLVGAFLITSWFAENRKYPPLLTPMLTSAGHAEDERCIATLEEFKSPCPFEAVAFAENGIGYAASGMPVRKKKHDIIRSSAFLKSEDGGRTWVQNGTMDGHCTEIVPNRNDVNFVVYHYNSSGLNPSSSEIWKCRDGEEFHLEPVFRFDDRKIIYKLHAFNDSTLVCGMNFEAFYRDSLMVSRDNGYTWGSTALPGIFRGDNSLAYSGNNVFVTILDEYEYRKSGLCVKDIITGKARICHFEGLGNIEASEDLFASDPGIAFRYNGNDFEETATFEWSHGDGKRSPKLLIKRGNLAICVVYQFPGDKGRRHCIFGSVDGGRHWQAIWMGYDVGCPTEHVSGAPDDAVSVFFTSGDRHYILTLRKKA